MKNKEIAKVVGTVFVSLDAVSMIGMLNAVFVFFLIPKKKPLEEGYDFEIHRHCIPTDLVGDISCLMSSGEWCEICRSEYGNIEGFKKTCCTIPDDLIPKIEPWDLDMNFNNDLKKYGLLTFHPMNCE